MARNRMLNPEFFLDEELATISAYARLLYEGLWGICDDINATFPNRPDWIKAQIFPYNDVKIEKLLSEVRGIGKIILFKEGDKEFWFLKNFSKHQKVDHPSKAKYPVFTDKNKILNEPSRVLIEESSSYPRTLALNRIEKKGIEKNIATDVAMDGGLVNFYLATFLEINPLNQRIFANKTERGAMDRIVKKLGAEKVSQLLEILPVTNSRPFYPRITKPTELERDFGKLKAAIEQDNNKEFSGVNKSKVAFL